MALELRTTKSEFVLEDKAGYKFKIVAQQHVDGDWVGGWHADVTFSTSGFKTAEAAVLHLQSAAEHFVRMLKEARDDQS